MPLAFVRVPVEARVKTVPVGRQLSKLQLTAGLSRELMKKKNFPMITPRAREA